MHVGIGLRKSESRTLDHCHLWSSGGGGTYPQCLPPVTAVLSIAYARLVVGLILRHYLHIKRSAPLPYLILPEACRACCPRAPEAVWQVWRPPYQSKIWYDDAIPIKSKAANLFIICNKSRIKTSAFLYVSEP